jgi:predicted  nucleic acid-binding Zn-ribbon protein
MLDFLQALKCHIKNELDEDVKRRAEICAKCPSKTEAKYSEILNSKMVEINGFVCGECHCPLATKIFAKEVKNICPKW